MYERLRTEVLPKLIPVRSKVLVAVSGGPDSVALGHILWRYSKDNPERELSLFFSHINHGLRPEANEEEQLVRRLAETLDVEFRVHRFNARQYAKEKGKSLEDGARAWRYACWREEQELAGARYIATAHHLGDQAETVLYRMIRGSGTAGLAGIYPSREGIIRPLLETRKNEILEYCHQEGLPYAFDRSNGDPIYARNKIRLELLPELEQSYNPQVISALGKTAKLMQWDESYIGDQVDKIWRSYCIVQEAGCVCLKIDVFMEPQAILSRLLRKAISYVSEEPRGAGYNYVEAIMESGGKAANWSQNIPGMTVQIEKKGIWFIRSVTSSVAEDFESELVVGKWKAIPALGIKAGLFPVDGEFLQSRNEDDNDEIYWDRMEIEKLACSLVIRNRRAGDVLWFRKIGHKTFKKVCQEEGVPARQRAQLSLIAAGNEVLWIPGIKKSDLCAPGQSAELLKCVFMSG